MRHNGEQEARARTRAAMRRFGGPLADLLERDANEGDTRLLFHLSKEALKRRLLDDLWKAKAATAPKSLSGILLSEVVVDAVRKELRRQTGYNGDVTEIARALRQQVIRAEAL